MNDDTIPRHLRVALANAARAFETGDYARLGTVNEDIQPLVDAAMARITRLDGQVRALAEHRDRVAMMIPADESTGEIEDDLAEHLKRLREENHRSATILVYLAARTPDIRDERRLSLDEEAKRILDDIQAARAEEP